MHVVSVCHQDGRSFQAEKLWLLERSSAREVSLLLGEFARRPFGCCCDPTVAVGMEDRKQPAVYFWVFYWHSGSRSKETDDRRAWFFFVAAEPV